MDTRIQLLRLHYTKLLIMRWKSSEHICVVQVTLSTGIRTYHIHTQWSNPL